MVRMRVLGVLLPLLLLQGGCSVLPFLFDGAEVVRATNRTDATIQCDVREGAEPIGIDSDAHIDSGASKDLAYSPGTINPRLYVWYQGFRHIYDIHPNFLGWDEIEVYEGDFRPVGTN